jgi:hypothetical protein
VPGRVISRRRNIRSALVQIQVRIEMRRHESRRSEQAEKLGAAAEGKMGQHVHGRYGKMIHVAGQ